VKHRKSALTGTNCGMSNKLPPDLARTGDVWLFRGHTMADRAIPVATNSPVNHVGMSVVIARLPSQVSQTRPLKPLAQTSSPARQ
jgi:hypothetical protein